MWRRSTEKVTRVFLLIFSMGGQKIFCLLGYIYNILKVNPRSGSGPLLMAPVIKMHKKHISLTLNSPKEDIFIYFRN